MALLKESLLTAYDATLKEASTSKKERYYLCILTKDK